MTTLGFLFMVTSIVGVVTLCGYCLWRVLTLPPLEVEDKLHGHSGIDTFDTEDAD